MRTDINFMTYTAVYNDGSIPKKYLCKENYFMFEPYYFPTLEEVLIQIKLKPFKYNFLVYVYEVLENKNLKRKKILCIDKDKGVFEIEEPEDTSLNEFVIYHKHKA